MLLLWIWVAVVMKSWPELGGEVRVQEASACKIGRRRERGANASGQGSTAALALGRGRLLLRPAIVLRVAAAAAGGFGLALLLVALVGPPLELIPGLALALVRDGAAAVIRGVAVKVRLVVGRLFARVGVIVRAGVKLGARLGLVGTRSLERGKARRSGTMLASCHTAPVLGDEKGAPRHRRRGNSSRPRQRTGTDPPVRRGSRAVAGQ